MRLGGGTPSLTSESGSKSCAWYHSAVLASDPGLSCSITSLAGLFALPLLQTEPLSESLVAAAGRFFFGLTATRFTAVRFGAACFCCSASMYCRSAIASACCWAIAMASAISADDTTGAGAGVDADTLLSWTMAAISEALGSSLSIASSRASSGTPQSTARFFRAVSRILCNSARRSGSAVFARAAASAAANASLSAASSSIRMAASSDSSAAATAASSADAASNAADTCA